MMSPNLLKRDVPRYSHWILCILISALVFKLFAKKIGSVFLAASVVRNIVGESDVIRIDKM